MNQNNKEKSKECEHLGKCYEEFGSGSSRPFGYCKFFPQQEKECKFCTGRKVGDLENTTGDDKLWREHQYHPQKTNIFAEPIKEEVMSADKDECGMCISGYLHGQGTPKCPFPDMSADKGEVKYTVKEIKEAINKAYQKGHKDDWGVDVIYKSQLLAVIKRYLPKKTKLSTKI